jgi:hypothetical protein
MGAHLKKMKELYMNSQIYLFIELINHYKRAEKQIVLYVAHHIITKGLCGTFAYFYKPTLIFHDLVLFTTYNSYTNFYLNMYYISPESVLCVLLLENISYVTIYHEHN